MNRPLALAAALLLTPAITACNDGPPLKAPSPDAPISTVRYQCQQNKTIVADYFDGKSSVGPDGRPIPGGRVMVQLSDGRKFSLPQTLSGSGIRYADSSGTFVFWSKGDMAFVETAFACGTTCGNGNLYALQRREGRWEVVAVADTWIS
jgi:membrane-bound inhibitor of C-type lysozyme